MAATSNESRRKAFKGFRVDSGDLAELGKWCLRFFEANDLMGLRPNLTGDLDVEKVKRIVATFPEAAGFGIGTKLSSEVKNVAGVIFKACMIDGRPTLKASNSLDKTTLPGCLQVFRGIDAAGNYVADLTGIDGEQVDIAAIFLGERPAFGNSLHRKTKGLCRGSDETLRRSAQLSVRAECQLDEAARRANGKDAGRQFGLGKSFTATGRNAGRVDPAEVSCRSNFGYAP